MDVFDGWRLLGVWFTRTATVIALLAMVFCPEAVTQVIIDHAQHRVDQLSAWLGPQLGLFIPSISGR